MCGANSGVALEAFASCNRHLQGGANNMSYSFTHRGLSWNSGWIVPSIDAVNPTDKSVKFLEVMPTFCERPWLPEAVSWALTGQAMSYRACISIRLFWMGVPDMMMRSAAGTSFTFWTSCIFGFFSLCPCKIIQAGKDSQVGCIMKHGDSGHLLHCHLLQWAFKMLITRPTAVVVHNSLAAAVP